MRIAFLLIATILAAQDDKSTLEVIVRDSITKSGIVGARVTITPFSTAEKEPEPTAAVTGVGGMVKVAGVAPGNVRLQVWHPTYSDRAFRQVRLTPGGKERIELDLEPPAAITGRVVDADGDPISNCSVSATNVLRPSLWYTNNTNERGEYRVHSLRAGKYRVTARCSQPVFQPRPLSSLPATQSTIGYALQFYPLASDFKSAEVFTLTPGTERRSVDFRMKPANVYAVTGTLGTLSMSEQRPQVVVRLFRSDVEAAESVSAFNAEVNLSKGTFRFQGVPPGEYTLVAGVMSGRAAERHSARMPIRVTDRDAEVAVELRPPMDLNGTVEFQQDRKIGSNSFSFELEPLDPGSPGRMRVQINTDGTFLIPAVSSGRWRIRTDTMVPYVKAIWMGDQELTDGILDTNSANGALRIRMGADPGKVRGTAPAKAGLLLHQRDQGGGRAYAIAGPNGEFTMPGVAPGKYWICQLQYRDCIDDDQEVIVVEGQTVTLELKPRVP